MCSWGKKKGNGLVSWEVGKEGVECLRGKEVVRGKGGPGIEKKRLRKIKKREESS